MNASTCYLVLLVLESAYVNGVSSIFADVSGWLNINDRVASIEAVLETILEKNAQLEHRIVSLEEENQRLKTSIKQFEKIYNDEDSVVVDAETSTEALGPFSVRNHPLEKTNGSYIRRSSAKKPRIVTSGSRTIAFTATLSSVHLTNLGMGQTIHYNNAITNIGSGYHTSTGIFTAPVGGVYVFSIETMVEPGDRQILHLVLNGVEVIPTYTQGTGDKGYESSSRIVTLRINKGDEMWVRTADYAWHGDGTIHGDNHSSFSGWLLAPTE